MERGIVFETRKQIKQDIRDVLYLFQVLPYFVSDEKGHFEKYSSLALFLCHLELLSLFLVSIHKVFL